MFSSVFGYDIVDEAAAQQLPPSPIKQTTTIIDVEQSPSSSPVCQPPVPPHSAVVKSEVPVTVDVDVDDEEDYDEDDEYWYFKLTPSSRDLRKMLANKASASSVNTFMRLKALECMLKSYDFDEHHVLKMFQAATRVE